MKDGFNSIQVTDLISSRDKIRKQIEGETRTLEETKKELSDFVERVSLYKKNIHQTETKYNESVEKLSVISKEVNEMSTCLDMIVKEIADRNKELKTLQSEIEKSKAIIIKNEVDINNIEVKKNKFIADHELEKEKLNQEIEDIVKKKDRLEEKNVEYVKQNKDIEQIKSDIILKKEELKDLNKIALKFKLAVLTEMSNTSGAERTK